MKLNTTAQYVHYLYESGALTSSDRVTLHEACGVAGLVPLHVTACEHTDHRVVLHMSQFGKLTLHESDTVSLLINE